MKHAEAGLVHWYHTATTVDGNQLAYIHDSVFKNIFKHVCFCDFGPESRLANIR